MSGAAIQKTASKTALLLQCPRSFSEGVELEEQSAGEAAIYGTRFHKGMAQYLKGDEPASARLNGDFALDKHIDAALNELRAWCAPSGNPFGLSSHVAEVETSRCLDLTKSSGGIAPISLR